MWVLESSEGYFYWNKGAEGGANNSEKKVIVLEQSISFISGGFEKVKNENEIEKLINWKID